MLKALKDNFKCLPRKKKRQLWEVMMIILPVGITFVIYKCMNRRRKFLKQELSLASITQ